MNIWVQSRIRYNMTYEEYKNNKNHKEPSNNNFFKNLLSRFLTIIVFTLLVIIISNNSPTFKSFIVDKVLNSTFDFSIVNKLIGNVTDIFNTKDNSLNVSKVYKDSEKYKDGIKYILNGEENVYLTSSGIVTFIGEKEGYNNTIIVQQSNGYYAWYGNVKESVKLYDYVEKDTVIGTATDEYYYVLLKDDKPVNINEN